MQETSLGAYDELKSSGKQSKQTEIILSKLTHGRDYSLREIQKITGYEINVISGRCNDLKKMNLLWEMPKRKCTISGKLIVPLALAQKQKDLFTTVCAIGN
jgi:hypothetical protein